MKWLTRWFLDNPVAANLLVFMIIAGGVLSLGTLRVESFPQLPPSQLVVSVAYPGGTARQVDDSITQRIEDAISSVAGIERISSTSQPGHAMVRVRKTTDTNLDRLIEDVRNEVDAIAGLPSRAERPVIYRDEFTNLASFVMVAGNVQPDVLQQVANRVERALSRHPQISKINNLGKRQPQLIIEPDQDELRRYGLGVSDLASRIQQWSLEYRSGELDTAQGKVLLRGDGYAENLTALRQLPVINTGDTSVTLGQIAGIRRSFADDDSVARFQGKPAVALMISTSRKDNLFDVSKAVQQVLADIKPTLPEAIQLDVMADMSPYIEDQLGLLGTNAWQGLVIVLVLLGLFLNVRLAFWVAVGIPISLSGALWIMGLPGLDYSINDITLFGMILVLGILVDDAVVVGESIHEARQRVQNPKEAAWSGVQSVAVATTFGALTTIAAFSPMLWIRNELAQMLAGFSAVVILALLFSLVESKFILPSHLAQGLTQKKANHLPAWLLKQAQDFCTHALDSFSRRVYQPTLRFSLQNPMAVLLIFITVMMMTVGLLKKDAIRTAFFPEIPGRYLTAKVTMNRDAPMPLTIVNADRLETALESTNRQLQQKYRLGAPPVERVITAVEQAASIEITAELTTESLRKIPGNTLLKVWQEQTGLLEGSYSVAFAAADNTAGGTALSVTAMDRKLARQAAKALREKLAEQPGVLDVYDDGQGGRRELRLSLNSRGRQLGLTKEQLAILVGGAFGELEVNRLIDRGEDTKMIVRLARESRKTMEQLMLTPVSIGDGAFVALADVADVKMERQPEAIYRRNRDEVISVYWRQDRTVLAPEKVWRNLQKTAVPDIERQYPGVKIMAVGEFEEITAVQSGFRKAMLLTLLLIYALLAIPLKSYWQPLIIMSVIPFGFVGAILGHGLMGLPVSLLSLFGMMAMTGVVINDSLVLMTRFNQLYREGMPVREALFEAGKSRLRAIFLTTVTTVCGLLPLLSETSEQAQYLKPAAVSLAFGELFATPVTLILIPILLGFGRYRSVSAQGEKLTPVPEETVH
ncbi:MAG: efflux RND transporter permease subunit [Endozoicomonas sp.]